METADVAEPKDPLSTPEPGGSRVPRFLVADDDADVRRLITFALRRDGAEVIEAASGTDLLDWAELTTRRSNSRYFDAIFSDIQMPGMTALEVLRRVPCTARDTPVILVTAFADPYVRVEAYGLGAKMVLSKPVDLDDIRALARAVHRRLSN